jgi:protein ImuB
MLFASVFIPDFPLQALFARKPELRTEAVALIDGKPPLLKVMAVNEKARKAGVEVGLMKAQAEMAGANVILRSPEFERLAHASLVACAHNFSPRVQDKAADLVVVDIEGLRSLFGSPEQVANRIRASVLEERLRVNVGVASNPDSATIAARGFHAVVIVREAKQIGSLPLTLLGPSSELLETMTLWGITTLGELAALDAGALSQRVGQEGVLLQKLARGQQVNPFVADDKELEFAERTDLEYSIELLDPLSFVISSLLERICANLEEHSLATNELDYELALDPPRVAGVELGDQELFHRRTIKMPNPTTDRKLLLRLVQLDLQSHPPTAPVMSVSLRVHAVRPRYVQQGLFAPQTPDPDKLELTTARLSNLLGENEVGSPELLDSHRPRAFVMGKFEPAKVSDSQSPSRVPSPKIALRLFEPARRASIRIRSDVPLQLSFDGKHGDVIKHSPPWLSSGEWWTEADWNRKEWDVQLQFADGAIADYRISIDLHTNQGFVEGSYD